MLKYNDNVNQAFSEPKFVLQPELGLESTMTSEAGEQPSGVWFKLVYDELSQKLY